MRTTERTVVAVPPPIWERRRRRRRCESSDRRPVSAALALCAAATAAVAALALIATTVTTLVFAAQSTALLDVSRARLLRRITEGNKTSATSGSLSLVSFASSGNATATTATTTTSTKSLSLANYTTCRTALIIADANRDDWLQSSEYVVLLTKFSPLVAPTAYTDLDPLFTDLFNGWINASSSSSGSSSSSSSNSPTDELMATIAVSLSGSKPGTVPTSTELDHLHTLCTDLYTTVLAYETNLANRLPVSAPSTSTSNAAPPTSPNSLTNEEFQACNTALIVSDLSRNEFLDATEFVRLINRLSSVVSSTTFDDLNVQLQQVYANTSVTTNMGIDIAGSKPGQTPTADQLVHLQYICQVVISTVAAVERNGGPTSPQDNGNDNDDIMPEDFSRLCRTAMLISDLDRNDALNEDEYVRFLNRLTYSQFSGWSFAELDPTLQGGFTSVAEPTTNAIDIAGSKPGTSPSDAETAHLQSVCVAAYTAIQAYTAAHRPPTAAPSRAPMTAPPPSPIKSCSQSLVDADLNLDHALDETEYLAFLNAYIGSSATNLTQLPFLLQDNFEWIKLEDATVNIRGATASSPGTDAVPSSLGDTIRTQWICNRTDAVLAIAQTFNQTTFVDQCTASVLAVDVNSDDLLAKSEYASLVNSLTDNAWEGYRFESMDAPLRLVYNSTMNRTTGLIASHHSRDTCVQLESAIQETRKDIVFFGQCKTLLSLSDTDGDSRLNSSEYVPFLYNLGQVYSLTDAKLEDLSFEDLNNGLQLNFDTIASGKDAVDISGLDSVVTSEKLQHLRRICHNTENVLDLINSRHTNTVTVYNSFVLANAFGIAAAGLTPQSRERVGLAEAYAQFVQLQLQITALPARNLRGATRRLALDKAVSFAEAVYEIKDSDCPAGQSRSNRCLTAFGSFYLSVIDMPDPLATSTIYSERTQRAIDDGALQLQLLATDPENAFAILKSSLPLKPSSSDPGSVLPDSSKAMEDERVNVPLIVGLIVVIALIAIGFAIYARRKRKDRIEGSYPSPAAKAPLYSLTTEGLIDHNSYHVGSDGKAPLSKSNKGPGTHPEQYPGTTSTLGSTHECDEEAPDFVREQCNILDDSFSHNDIDQLEPTNATTRANEDSNLNVASEHSGKEELKIFLHTLPDVVNVDTFEYDFNVQSEDESASNANDSTDEFVTQGEAEVIALDSTTESRTFDRVQRDKDGHHSIASDIRSHGSFGNFVESMLPSEANESRQEDIHQVERPAGIEDFAAFGADGCQEPESSELGDGDESVDSNEELHKFAVPVPEESAAFFDIATPFDDARDECAVPVETDVDYVSDDFNSFTRSTPQHVRGPCDSSINDSPTPLEMHDMDDEAFDISEQADETSSSLSTMEQAQRFMASVPIEANILHDSFLGGSDSENDNGNSVNADQATEVNLEHSGNAANTTPAVLDVPQSDELRHGLDEAESGIISPDPLNELVIEAQATTSETVVDMDMTNSSGHTLEDEACEDKEDGQVEDDDGEEDNEELSVSESVCTTESEESETKEDTDVESESDDDDPKSCVDDIAPDAKPLEDGDEGSSSCESDGQSDDGNDISVEEDEPEETESSSETAQSDQDDMPDQPEESSSCDEADTLINSTASVNSADLREAYEKYRPIVESLVRQVVPDEIDNVDSMMEQFLGREAELVATLKKMVGSDEGSESIEECSEASEQLGPVEDENTEEGDSEEATEENEESESTETEEEVIEEEVIDEEVSEEEEEVTEEEEEVSEEDEIVEESETGEEEGSGFEEEMSEDEAMDEEEETEGEEEESEVEEETTGSAEDEDESQDASSEEGDDTLESDDIDSDDESSDEDD
jgi:hypothetical protein